MTAELAENELLTVTLWPLPGQTTLDNVVIDSTARTIDEIEVMVSINGHTVDLSHTDALRLYELLHSRFGTESTPPVPDRLQLVLDLDILDSDHDEFGPVLDNFCCRGECCGIGSWCCSRAGTHDHDEGEVA